jgi:hypothetical protein
VGWPLKPHNVCGLLIVYMRVQEQLDEFGIG